MVFTPIIVKMRCGANPANLVGLWQVLGYGIIGLYKSDWDRAGGFGINKTTWGGEDYALMDQLVSVGLEFERMRIRIFITITTRRRECGDSRSRFTIYILVADNALGRMFGSTVF